jgi:hypothetical protein
MRRVEEGRGSWELGQSPRFLSPPSSGSPSIAWRLASICMSDDVVRGVIRKFGLNMPKS